MTFQKANTCYFLCIYIYIYIIYAKDMGQPVPTCNLIGLNLFLTRLKWPVLTCNLIDSPNPDRPAGLPCLPLKLKSPHQIRTIQSNPKCHYCYWWSSLSKSNPWPKPNCSLFLSTWAWLSLVFWFGLRFWVWGSKWLLIGHKLNDPLW